MSGRPPQCPTQRLGQAGPGKWWDPSIWLLQAWYRLKMQERFASGRALSTFLTRWGQGWDTSLFPFSVTHAATPPRQEEPPPLRSRGEKQRVFREVSIYQPQHPALSYDAAPSGTPVRRD